MFKYLEEMKEQLLSSVLKWTFQRLISRLVFIFFKIFSHAWTQVAIVQLVLNQLRTSPLLVFT